MGKENKIVDRLIKRLKLRPFEKFDWNGYAGAENFENGSPPLYGEISINRKTIPEEFPELEFYDFCVVVDGKGIELDLIDRDGNFITYWKDGNKIESLTLLNGLEIPLDFRLIELVFSRFG